jgi:hypothetical protein
MGEKRLKSGKILIALTGKKQVGKDTSFKFIQELMREGPLQYINAVQRWAFADKLKDVTADLFGLDRAKFDGTDLEKDSPTHLKWENVSSALYYDFFGEEEPYIQATGGINEFVTHRELLQLFGTNACRGIMSNLWPEYLRRSIENSQAAINVVTDARFPNEIEMLREMGGYIVRLYRNTGSNLATNHPSETALDKYRDVWFDFVIGDNGNRTMGDLKESWRIILQNILPG